MSIIEAPQTEEEIEVTEIDEVTETLIKAENYIREHGWYQGYYWPQDAYDDDGLKVCANDRFGATSPVCLVGAIFRVKRVRSICADPVVEDVIDRIINVLAKRGFSSAMAYVPQFNDAEGRTVEEVYDLLQEAREV